MQWIILKYNTLNIIKGGKKERVMKSGFNYCSRKERKNIYGKRQKCMMKRNMVCIFIFGLMLICIIVGVFVFHNRLTKNSVIAYIGTEKVYYGEYLLYSSQIKTEVIHEITNKYEIEYDDKFWSSDIKGKTPLDIVKERTMEKLVPIKSEQALMKQFDVSEGLSYKEFENLLKKENRKRLEKEKTGKTNYGKTEYSEEIFYTLLQDQNVTLLKEKIASGMDLSDKVLRDEYDQLKVSDDSFKLPGEFTVQKVDADNSEIVDTIVYNAEKIESMGNIPGYEYTMCINLSEGEQTEIFQDIDGKKYFYICTERREDTYRSFEEMKSSVKSFLIQEEYNRLLEQVDTRIEYTEKYEQIKLEE